MAKKKIEEVVEVSNIDSFLQEMNKAAGRTVAYIPAKSNGAFDVKRMSSGVLAIDIATGGGYPLGRNIYLVGPKSTCKSTLMYLAMANMTQEGNVYIEDAENTFDNNYAKKLGVDTEKMGICRSRTAEEAFNHYRCATDSGIFKGVFLDSLAALQPAKLVDGTNSDNVMGGIGRITSTNMANLEKDKFSCNEQHGYMPTIFYTNQIRKKVGMVFGCLRGDTIIPCADGTSYPISEIVKKRKKVEVWSLNEETREIVKSKVTGWHYNGEANSVRDFLEIEYKSGTDNVGKASVTKKHLVYANSAWAEASTLKVGDLLRGETCVMKKSILYALLMCSDTFLKRDRKGVPYLVIKECEDNTLFLHWKVNSLLRSPSELYFSSGFSMFGVKCVSNPTFVITADNVGKKPIIKFADNLSYEGLAIWYATDGGFIKNNMGTSIFIPTYGRRYTKDEVVYLIESLKEFTGLKSWVYNKKQGFTLGYEEGFLFLDSIKKYTPSCEKRRLPSELKGSAVGTEISAFEEQVYTVTGVREGDSGALGKYDLTVEDYHNYLAGDEKNGIVVHNSPDTEPGGEAPDFYASVRIDLSPGERVEEDGVVVGGKFTFRVTKNKTFPAWRTGEFYMRNDGITAPYISNEWTLMDLAVRAGVLEKAGSWYKYMGSNIAQGAMNALAVIQEFPAYKKNEMLDYAMQALYSSISLKFRFEDGDKGVTIMEGNFEEGQDEVVTIGE